MAQQTTDHGCSVFSSGSEYECKVWRSKQALQLLNEYQSCPSDCPYCLPNLHLQQGYQRRGNSINIDGQTYAVTKRGLFSLTDREYYNPHKFTKKQKRHYLRQKSGLEIAIAKKERITFVTLSTQYDIIKQNGKILKDSQGKSIPANPQKRAKRLKGLNKAWQKLQDQIEYFQTSKHYETACRKQHKIPYIHSVKRKKKIAYSALWEECQFYFKYFKVKTDEGGGVLHIVFRKARDDPPIPHPWLVKHWRKIWGSSNVSISEILVTDANRLALYMIGQYFAKQPIIRMSYGRRWIGTKIKERISHLIDVYGFKRAKEIWSKNHLQGSIPTGKTGYQKRFRWRKLATKIKPFPIPKDLLTVQTCLDSDRYGETEAFLTGSVAVLKTTLQSRPWFRMCKTNNAHNPIIKSV